LRAPDRQDRRPRRTIAGGRRWGGAATPRTTPKAKSFIKTLKVEAVYPMAYETFEDVASIWRASSTTSTAAGGCTRPSAT
jgi:hypothetical protein